MIDGDIIENHSGQISYHDTHNQPRIHPADVMAASNLARRARTFCGLTHYEDISRIWAYRPDRFIPNLIHQMPGPNT